MTKYFHNWSNVEEVHSDFMDYRLYEKGLRIDGFPKDDEILFASYASGSYSGDSIVLFERDGELYINEASHCSCYGLEDSWSPCLIHPAQLVNEGPTEYSDHGEEARAAWAEIMAKFGISNKKEIN